jgi:phosphatidylserine/phosphatidylglycerophosphate/cardiolipin synthase-like enzyme
MSRIIRKSNQRSSAEASHLLSTIFLAELLEPSKCLWIVSPWISDVPLIDNCTNSISSLRSFGPRFIRLTEILAKLAEEGTTVVVGTIDADSNHSFLTRIKSAFRDRDLEKQLIIDIDKSNKLHEKAITADDLTISGSMNITNNGIYVREEIIELHTNEDFVARARMDAFERFGGVL